LSLSLSKDVLLRRLLSSNHDKDTLFAERLTQLQDLLAEIKRFETLIKSNANQVDNLILPQLKAMSATYTAHKLKYKKLKQASFVLSERIKRAKRELEQLPPESNQKS
jgi:predicted  nucleic acid-binding Zn-ribbon protein